jgi:glycosyltransferase involved in cell wall biosynthesis
MKSKRILLNTPDINKPGGVANFYLGLNGKFKDEVIYNFIGGSSKKSFFVFNLIADYFRFMVKIFKLKPSIIHINPSLDRKSLLRDSVFILIAKFFGKKLLISWHGWQLKTERSISDKHKSLFRFFFGKADGMTVLSGDFKNTLLSWGIKCEIYVETTLFEDSLIEGLDIHNKQLNNDILFLSRVEEKKGIYVVIDSFAELSKEIDCSLTIAGSGSELEKTKNYVNDRKIKNIRFAGYVTGESKISLFNNNSVFILPSHTEGMPISMLEAMAFGLAVVSRPVGGIKGFFENGKMGYITDSLDSKDYHNILKGLFADKEKLKEISVFNHNYAIDKFSASKVAARFSKIYSDIQNC